MSKWIRQGDKIVALAGNDKGKVGPVLSRTRTRVIVEGLNIRKKHVKKSEQYPQGGILEIEGSMDISSVSICNAEGKAVKLRVRFNKDGARELYYKDGKKEVLYRSVKKPAKV